jgi:hypothetical protein
MKKTISILILLILIPMLCFAGALQEKQRQVIAKKNVAGGGPNAWYYSGAGTDSYDGAEAGSPNATEIICNHITYSSSGTITKLGYREYEHTGSDTIKLAIFNTSGSQLNAGCSTNGTVTTEWNECTLGSPYSWTSGDIYVCAIGAAGITEQIYTNTTGGTCKWQSGVYADFPASYSTLTLSNCGSTTKSYAFKAYVD